MGQDPRQTVDEIEETREELARKVDELVDRAKVEAGELGKKLAIAGAVLVGVMIVGMIAKRRVGS
ncbi:MAG: DUF3618 domain-containing protein [Actinomycetota bacterium]